MLKINRIKLKARAETERDEAVVSQCKLIISKEGCQDESGYDYGTLNLHLYAIIAIIYGIW